MGLKIASVYYAQSDAVLARSSLEAASIPSFIFDHHTTSIFPHLGVCLGGMRLMVADSDYEVAVGLLHSESKPDLNEFESETEAFKRFSGPLFLAAPLLLSPLLMFGGVWFPFWNRYRRKRS